MKLFKLLVVAILISTITGCKPSLCEPDANALVCHFPDRNGFVNDCTDLLNEAEINALEKTIADFHIRTGIGIVIVIEDTPRRHSRKFHCPANIAHMWKMGAPDKCKDFIIAISKKRTYVDVSYGSEFSTFVTGPDRTHILNKIIIPAFRKKQYYEGLNNAITYVSTKR